MTRNPRQIIVSATKRKTEQINEPLFATGQSPAQAQEALTVFAKRIEPYIHRPAIRPQDLISFERNFATLTIFGRVAPK
jgi:hypothetical protein